MKVETAHKDSLVQARIPSELKEKLYAIADQTDTPAPQIFRKLIAEFVKKNEKHLPNLA